MAEAITVRSERGFTISVNDIEHMESRIAPRPRHHQSLLPSRRAKIEAAVGAAHRHLAIPSLHSLPPGIDAAQHPPLQRLQRAHPAIEHFERHAPRAAALRPTATTSSAPRWRTCEGATFPLPYGGKSAPDLRRSRPARALRARPLRQRRRQRHQRAEHHPALRLRQDRRRRNTTSSSTARPMPPRPSTACRSARPTAPPSMSAMSRMCAMATPCRPTSCATTARAPRCSRCSRTADLPRSKSSTSSRRSCRASAPPCRPRSI